MHLKIPYALLYIFLLHPSSFIRVLYTSLCTQLSQSLHTKFRTPQKRTTNNIWILPILIYHFQETKGEAKNFDWMLADIFQV